MKKLEFVGSALEDLRAFPEDVRGEIGYALYLAQLGEKHQNAEPMRGYTGSGVLEIIDDFDGDTYRTVYTVRLSEAVFVLHAFQKKAKKGIKTPKRDIDLVNRRLKDAEQINASLATQAAAARKGARR